MSETYIDAGSLNERLELLELAETAENSWEWVDTGKLWARVEQNGNPQKKLFSSVGIGARNAELVIRRRPLTLHQALRWNGQHLFLTSITKRDRMHLNVAAALVDLVICRAKRSRSTVDPERNNRPISTQLPEISFPGVLTEKYVRHAAEDTYANAKTLLVLVTPKAIELLEGDLITILDGPAAAVYNVQARHVLDEFKNEYEILWSRDV